MQHICILKVALSDFQELMCVGVNLINFVTLRRHSNGFERKNLTLKCKENKGKSLLLVYFDVPIP